MKPLIVLLLFFLFAGCVPSEREKKRVIGLSQCMLDDAWRQAMLREMQIEASNYDNLEIIVKDANSDNDTQIRQIRELIDRKVDVLIISPFQSKPITAVAEEAFRAGIPTIITDRKVDTELYTTFVGADNYAIGREAGRYAARHLSPGATVLEVWGLASSSPARERHQGFTDALHGCSGLNFIQVEGEWLYDTARVRLNRMEWPFPVDFVFSHNDMMAIAAREYFLRKDSAFARHLPVIGVDAVPGAGLEAVADGRIHTSFLYPTGGEQVVRAAVKILNGEPVDKYIPLQTGEIDQSAARTLLIQSDRLLNYQQRIEQQRSNISALLNRFLFLKSSLGIISALMIGFVLLSVYTFYINAKLKKRNRELREINRKEEEQRQKLISLNAEIKEVTAQKLQFFTNVSHEVRTPLTLILDPLDHLMEQMSGSPYLPALGLIRKNAGRLYRVINQILDFRKMENKQERLQIQPVDLVAFAGEVKSYFDSLAGARQIRYTFIPPAKPLEAWIDADKIEKVLVNLLSNAFKFTPEGGTVVVRLTDEGEQWLLVVEDNGRGIQPEKIPYLFDRFYTDHSPVGTGIGLHLAKEYVNMHKGEIVVTSVPDEKTIFSIRLPKSLETVGGDATCLQPEPAFAGEVAQPDDSEEKKMLATVCSDVVLIVEDDDEVRSYLQEELRRNFAIRVAMNGREALEVLRNEEVSLVLSDVMMPEMNGFDLCRAIKSDLSISHLPVILLTALSDERQCMYGLTGGADDYIRKPFRMNYVKVKIMRLLEERRRLREQLLRDLQAGNLLLAEPEKTGNREDAFLRKFIACIDAVYADPDYNVEKLSDTLNLSRGHLYRKIKELTGTTPVDFLRNYRLGKAACLLREKELTVSEVAYRTGFSSPAYFTKCFRAVYHTTPTDFI